MHDFSAALGDLGEHIRLALLAPLLKLIHPGDQFSALSLVGGLVLIGLVYLARRAGRRSSLRGFFRFVFPRRIWLHPSAMTDLRYYFVNVTVMALFFAWIYVSGDWVKDQTIAGLTALFGPPAKGGEATWLTYLVTTVVIVLAVDLGYWIPHWLMHRIPALWEFHKVHHSAEVMTPFTEWRQHPVEYLMSPLFISTALGLAYGSLAYGMGDAAQEITFLKVNALLMVYFLTVVHLRHTHVPLAFTGLAGILIQSPVHHQIHHSTDPKHFDKNLGFCLSFWDWVFGTLYMPRKGEKLEFGVGEESKDFKTIRDYYVVPFEKLAARWRGDAEALIAPKEEAPPPQSLGSNATITPPASAARTQTV